MNPGNNNNKAQETTFQRQIRKSHDLIFFIIFLASLSFNITAAVFGSEYSMNIEKKLAYNAILKMFLDLKYILILLSTPFIFAALVGIMKRFPSEVIYTFSFIVLILQLLPLILVLERGGSPDSVLVGFTIVSSISMLCFLFYIRRKMNHIKLILSYVAEFIFKHFLGLLFFSIFDALSMTLTVLACFYLYCVCDYSRFREPCKTLFSLLGLLQIFWFCSNLYYSHLFYVAGFVYLNIKSRNRSSFKNALKSLSNTAVAVGTICLAGLLDAILNMLKYRFNCCRDRSRRSSPGLLLRFALFCLSFLLEMLYGLLEEVNRWSMVYSAVHGTSYKTSVYQSSRLMTSVRNNFFSVRNIVALVSGGITLFCGNVLTSVIWFCFLKDLIHSKPFSEPEIWLLLLLSALPIILLASLALNIYIVALTISYSYIQDPSAAEDAFPRIREVLFL